MKKYLWVVLMVVMLPAKSAPVDSLRPLITDTDVQVQVAYAPLTGIYEYHYTLVSGATNAGEIVRFVVDVGATVPQANLHDPDLFSDESRFLDEGIGDPVDAIPSRTIPVGIQAPYPFIGWVSGVSIDGWAIWGATDVGRGILPAQTQDRFIIQAKAPPGARAYRIEPNYESTDEEGPMPQEFWVTGATIGPVLPSELKLINGRGQSSVVNEFLAYSNLTATRTTLPANTKGFDLVVKYGNTTIPSTFGATLNGVNVTASFRPNPGAFDVVRIPLGKGTNKLLLSIEGLKPSGAQSRDTDSLTFIVR